VPSTEAERGPPREAPLEGTFKGLVYVAAVESRDEMLLQNTRRAVITGGLGFLGSAFIRRMIGYDVELLNVDANTYAGDPERLSNVSEQRLHTELLDVAEKSCVNVFTKFKPEIVVHFAAESHVTRSEQQVSKFHRSNVEGTRNVLEAAVGAGASLFVHISTDEVYGPCPAAPFTEDQKAPGIGRATSAYARSKAIADDVARSFVHRIPVIIIRPTNCFGPWQHPEKAIPRWIIKALTRRRIPVWGDGRQVRDWMFVEDCCSGIELAIERGQPGEAYNLAPQAEQHTNLEIASLIAQMTNGHAGDVYLTDYDRPDHDRRYAIDASKMHRLGWHPSTSLDDGLKTTVNWYREHSDWWTSLVRQAEMLYDDATERAAGK
jgi:dTDP-glucose 4,6-dehydratase